MLPLPELWSWPASSAVFKSLTILFIFSSLFFFFPELCHRERKRSTTYHLGNMPNCGIPLTRPAVSSILMCSCLVEQEAQSVYRLLTEIVVGSRTGERSSSKSYQDQDTYHIFLFRRRFRLYLSGRSVSRAKAWGESELKIKSYEGGMEGMREGENRPSAELRD